jgi:hypothetical protein
MRFFFEAQLVQSTPSPLRGGIKGGGPAVDRQTTPSPALPSRGRVRKSSRRTASATKHQD